jgi:hypothetical protein
MCAASPPAPANEPSTAQRVIKWKIGQALFLQATALATVVLLVGIEWGHADQWGEPRRPLWGFLVIGVTASVLALFAWGIGFWRVSDTTDERRARGVGNNTILGIFVIDVLGLFCLMLLSRGTPGLLSLFAVITAVVITMTCRNATEATVPPRPCPMCHRGFLRRPFLGWCIVPAVLAFTAYGLGL